MVPAPAAVRPLGVVLQPSGLPHAETLGTPVWSRSLIAAGVGIGIRLVLGGREPAAGRRRGGDQALGRSKGGVSTRLHLRAERGAKPVVLLLTGGERTSSPCCRR